MTKIIYTRKGEEILVSDEDYDYYNQFLWCVNNNGYARKYPGVLMHREIMKAPKGLEVDHINGKKLDNRRENLRICTRYQNIISRRMLSHNRVGFKGVAKAYKGKFSASIRHNKKSYYLGNFNCPKAAAKAYNDAAIRLFGEFATLNVIPE